MTRVLWGIVLTVVCGGQAFAQTPLAPEQWSPVRSEASGAPGPRRPSELGGVQGSPPSKADDYGIVDNSFLIEEAFNQDPGVFQNIFTLQRWRHQWVANFTQEWPAPGMRHQLSYTVPFGRFDEAAGAGDVLVNYRFQALMEGPGRPAFSPRVSVILPTANSSSGLGAGTTSWQVALPFSKRAGDLYFHWNTGFTYIPAHVPDGGLPRQQSLIDVLIGGSLIWRTAPAFNLLIEAMLQSTEEPLLLGSKRSAEVTLSPGFRTAWNGKDSQFVWGLAAPISRSDGRTEVSVLVYLSYELPFRK